MRQFEWAPNVQPPPEILRLAPFVGSRVRQPEFLDQVPAGHAGENLADMARVNRWLGGFRVLRSEMRALGVRGPASVLDIAAANGAAARWLERKLPGSAVTSTDLRPDLLLLGSGRRAAADATRLPFRDGSFDVTISTLFLHHLSDEELVAALGEMLRVSRRGVVAVDLVRSGLSYRFLHWTAPLLRWHWLTCVDGARSVQAAYSVAEMRALVARAGFRDAVVRAHPPWFRLSVRIPKR